MNSINIKPLLCAIITFIVITALTSCSLSTKGTVAITNPIRTLENMTSGEQEKLKTSDTPKVIAIAQLSNSTTSIETSSLLRGILQSHLSNKNFQLVHTKEVDLKNPENKLSPQQLAQTLGVDAVVVGEVIEYERFYAGIYAHIKLGVDIQLISKEGKVLWHKKEIITSRAGGLSTSPWGILLNAALAAQHLKDNNLFAAADELGRSIAKEFPEPAGYNGKILPTIDMVIHDGSNKWLKYNDNLAVAIKGQAGLRAILDIEGIGSFDLKEQGSGIYKSDIIVDKRWNGEQKIITGKLIDGTGQITQMISTTGLVNFDNTNPTNVEQLKVDFATIDEVKLSWKNNNQEQVEYKVIMTSPQNNLAKTTNITKDTNITLPGNFAAFTTLTFTVITLDQAENESAKTVISTKVYPIKLSKTNTLSSRLSGSYQGTNVLSKENSPYIITSNTAFTEDSTLIIEPDVKVKFKKGANIAVQGSAYFWGKTKLSSTSIIFESESKLSPAKKLLTLDSSQTIEINGLQLKNSGVGIEIKSGSPRFEHLYSDNAKYTALTISGHANVKISNCQFNGSSTSAIVLSGRSRLSLDDCSFINNQPFHIQNSSVFPVIAKDVTFDKSTKISVLGALETN
ncbi:MAG: right-handed parallel beta-helix repeat-containing protein [Colwellia sp.]|nr:right-handed parallel beta-helix repeat-containing protein [Colwellia sp.]